MSLKPDNLKQQNSEDSLEQQQPSYAIIEEQSEIDDQKQESNKSVKSKDNVIGLYSFNNLQQTKKKSMTNDQNDEQQQKEIKKQFEDFEKQEDQQKQKKQQNQKKQQKQNIKQTQKVQIQKQQPKKKPKKKNITQDGQPKRFEHLYNLNKVRQQAIQALKEQAITEEDKQLYECTFKPQLLETSLMIAEHQGQGFHERNQDWLERKMAKIEEKDKKNKEREEFLCTFNPKIYRAMTPRKMKSDKPLKETTKMFIERQKKAQKESEQKKDYLNYVNKKKKKQNVAPQVSGYKKIYQKLTKEQEVKKQDQKALEKQIQKYTHTHVPVKINQLII